MRIVDLKTFRELPVGTICSKYQPCSFEHIFAKGRTLEHDFLLAYLTDEIDADSSEEFADKLFEAQRNGSSVGMCFDTTMRDGCFENDQLFCCLGKI